MNPPCSACELRTLIVSAEYVLFAFSMTVTETSEPVCKLEGATVDVRINFVALVNVT